MERRKFIKTTATGMGVIAMPSIVPSTVFGKSAPSNKIQIGQIGFGRIASSHDLPDTLRHDVSRVMAVCDLDSKRLADGKKFIDEFYANKSGKKKKEGY
jgi:myo-inositol 2-dehydrogenase/D-chiro-inositol 1-dehydrogenase